MRIEITENAFVKTVGFVESSVVNHASPPIPPPILAILL